MTSPDLHPHRRFSQRVDNYVRYRPSYPAALLPVLEDAVGLTAQMVVADVGAGTGIFSRLLLDYGCTVYGVEPNEKMRAAATTGLAAYDRFRPVAGSAAATTLPDDSVDLVTAAQSFHWFEPEGVPAEMRRILRPSGALVVVYNVWRGSEHPFLAAFDDLVRRYDPEEGAQTANPLSVPQRLDAFFGEGGYETATLPNPYTYDWAGLRGRALSNSYAPLPDSPGYEPFLRELRALFDAFALEGVVHFPYTTRLAWGTPRAARDTG